MTDPTTEAQANVRSATERLGAALSDAFKAGLRQAIAKQIAEDYGPGPWTLHEDGRVEPVTPPEYHARCTARTAKGEQCKREVSHTGATTCVQHHQTQKEKP